MSNDGICGRNKRYDSIGGDVSGILPLNVYHISADAAVDAQKILAIVGKGTRCLWHNGVQITTDRSVNNIARELGVPKSSIYVH